MARNEDGGGRRERDEVVQVDPHAYLVGRERPPPEADAEILGRTAGDSEKLFPRYTHASAAVTGEVRVNGKVLKLWQFAQLEVLSRPVLKERAMAIRDALGEGECPPIPSGQKEDVVRWILHMQAQLTNDEQQVGRQSAGGYGAGGHLVPKAFAKDSKERPIRNELLPGERPEQLPFGPRVFNNTGPARDTYADLKFQRNEFEQAPNLGITTMRPGGEGRRHLPTPHNMVTCGVSTAEPQGIQTLKNAGEGRRPLGVRDHIMEQKTGVEVPQASPRGRPSPRSGDGPVRHVSESHMRTQGIALPPSENPIGGERRKHAVLQDHMMNTGTSEAEEQGIARGRKYLDHFAGPRSNFSDSHETYQSTWKKDPSRLGGNSMLV